MTSSSPPATVEVYTREAEDPRRRPSAQTLASHRLHAVDYTGSVRVWTAELLLARLLLAPTGRALVRDRSVPIYRRASLQYTCSAPASPLSAAAGACWSWEGA